jgi:hypothetical protein
MLTQLVHDRADCGEAIASADKVVEVLETMQASPEMWSCRPLCLGALASPLSKDSVVRIERELFARRAVCAALRLHHGRARLQALLLRRPPTLTSKSDRDAEVATPRTPAWQDGVQH